MRIARPNLGLFALVLVFLHAFAPRATAQTYIVTDLGTLGGKSSGALGINNAGMVVGVSENLDGVQRAVLFTNNVLAELAPASGSSSTATDLNSQGQAVGWVQFATNAPPQAVMFQNGTVTNLGTLLVSSTQSVTHAINDAGTVVGEYFTTEGEQRPFLYANGTALDLGFAGVAACINEAGQIGGFEIAAGARKGFVLTGGRRVEVGSLGSNDTAVAWINTNGVAVGTSQTGDGAFHAFAFEAQKIHDLGTLGGVSSAAFGVNNPGAIVGQADDPDGNPHAFIYQNGQMADLNKFLVQGTGWVLTKANAINDSGQIVGLGQIKGETHGFLLTPNFIGLAFYPGLTIGGKVGRTYRIEYLDALGPTNSWRTLTNLVLPVSPFFFVDPRPVAFANRLYRLVLLP